METDRFFYSVGYGMKKLNFPKARSFFGGKKRKGRLHFSCDKTFTIAPRKVEMVEAEKQGNRPDPYAYWPASGLLPALASTQSHIYINIHMYKSLRNTV